MDHKELIQVTNELLSGKIKALDITGINHKPHPFTLGAKHVSWADHWSGMLGENAILDAEKHNIGCGYPGCMLEYKEHTHDTVMFLQLTQNLTKEEATELLQRIPLIENKIDGIVFVDTPEKYRIT